MPTSRHWTRAVTPGEPDAGACRNGSGRRPCTWFAPTRTYPSISLRPRQDACGGMADEAIAAVGDPASRLACIPTFDRFVIPPQMPDERWPNLVVKLSDADKAKAVAMGRFETEDDARRALQLDGRADAIPGIFGMTLPHRLLNALLPGKTRVLYQPFIPPTLLADVPARFASWSSYHPSRTRSSRRTAPSRSRNCRIVLPGWRRTTAPMWSTSPLMDSAARSSPRWKTSSDRSP